MNKYAILQNPGHNRVYFQESKKLCFAELSIATSLMSINISDISDELIGGVSYICFNCDMPLSENDLSILSQLSFVYAIFLRKDNYLIPIWKDCCAYFDNDLNTILRYSGKTNELFTKFMLNMAIMVYMKNKNIDIESIKVLDPVCGKGTTLFEALSLGCDAFGVDIDKASIHDLTIYFKKYLETKKYKHSMHKERITIDKNKCEKILFDLSRGKAHKKLSLQLILGDSKLTDLYFKRNSLHVIVGDLPYGVLHSNKGGQFKGTRNPSEFLINSLPAWNKVLLPGGVLALAWNNFLLKRSEFAKILYDNGFTIPEDHLFSQFAHRVDQSINRDLIIAIKP